MKHLCLFLLLFCSSTSFAQPFSIIGKVQGLPTDTLLQATITITQQGQQIHSAATTTLGGYNISGVPPGAYTMVIIAIGYATHHSSISITDASITIPTIHLQPISQTLDEVKIVSQAIAMTQHDDTTEYNAAAYKVNPDADAADLIRKMPAIEINGTSVKAQGEAVLKVLVDGKPFFGEDAWATLKTLPADVIQKVQLYNEKSDQERFTGFSEGQQNKTINIVTHPHKRHGVFGNAFAGGGNSSSQSIYGSGINLHRFSGQRRISLTAQSNNVNLQNFTDQSTAATAGSGITTTHAAGLNYTNKWGTHTDATGSYAYSHTSNAAYRNTRRTYLLPTAAGQIYDEQSPTTNNSHNHRANMRISYQPDTLHTLLLQPALTLTSTGSAASRTGTMAIDYQPLNATTNRNTNDRTSILLSNNLLYTHRLGNRGHTLSAAVNTSYNHALATTQQYAQNTFYTDTQLSTTQDQRIHHLQHGWSLSGNATYTHPMGTHSLLKLQTDVATSPTQTVRDVYDYNGSAYFLPDTALSNSFIAAHTTYKASTSYQHRQGRHQLSGGIGYQWVQLHNTQLSPGTYTTTRTFTNLLPLATWQYRITSSRHLQGQYTTTTRPPSVAQLQTVVNNTDPLHLSTGNAQLRQPYTHTLSLRYNASGHKGSHNTSVSLTANVTRHYISSQSLIYPTDTNIMGISLPAGVQLTLPVNIQGNAGINTNVSYSIPLTIIKSRFSINANGGLQRIPSIINGSINYQQSRTLGLNLVLTSNISQQFDFNLSSGSNISFNQNPVSKTTTTFISQHLRASTTLLLWQTVVFNSSLAWQGNFGLSAGFNRNILLCNIALGKKLFRKRQGELRFSINDLLNQNTNIQRTITDSYIQDLQTNLLQRYYMLVFTYKISSFGK